MAMSVETSNSPSWKKPENVDDLSSEGGQGTRSPRGFMTWWYQLAAPAEPEHATAEDRERVRAGRLSSIILLMSFVFGLSQLPNALVSPNPYFLIVLLISMAINIGAFVVNRQGKVLAAGIIQVIVVELAFILIVASSTRGISSRTLTVFHLMVLTELLAVSLLPPKSVFLAFLANALFTWAAITFLPRTVDLVLTTSSAYYSALASPLALQGTVALVTYLWVQGARQAIARAERTALLEHALAERDRLAAEQKQQLEEGIQQILQTHIQAANGNFEARAPLAKENILWQVASALNTLIARLQRTIHAEQELQRTKTAALQLTEVIHQAKRRQQPVVRLQKSGTILDSLAQELTETSIHPR